MTKATGKRVPGAHALLALAAATNTETNSNSLRSLKREAAEKARAARAARRQCTKAVRTGSAQRAMKRIAASTPDKPASAKDFLVAAALIEKRSRLELAKVSAAAAQGRVGTAAVLRS